MFITRNNERTEHDDFVLRVKPYMGSDDGATKVYDAEGEVIGWKIKPMYE